MAPSCAGVSELPVWPYVPVRLQVGIGRRPARPDVEHGAKPIDLSADYHLYAVEWSRSALRFYVDGASIGNLTAANALIPRSPFYLIMNVAICHHAYCDAFGLRRLNRSRLPGRMEIDYVRVYEWSDE